jgi:ABC-2 type transport system ATP-binding protein
MADMRELCTAERRELLQQVGLAVGLGTLVGSTASSPVSALEADNGSFTTTDVTVTSLDGTEIAATLYEPTAEGPHPAILATHGWGGNRGDVGLGGFASNGYVGLAYDSRGFGDSGGKVTLTGENEQQDAEALITWLANRDSVLTDGPDNPRLGLEGGSYGGGIQFRMAAYDDRVDAIVPEYTWHDLTQALVPNGVLKQGWALGLFAVGLAAADPSDEFTERNNNIIENGSLTEADRTYYESRSTVGYPDDTGAAALIVQEFTDRLFPPGEGVDNFEWARENGPETALILGNGTAHAQIRAGDEPPGVDTYEQFVGQAVIDWLDAHLKDAGGHGLAPVNYYDQSTDEFVEAEQFPPERTWSRVFSHALDQSVTLSGPDGGPVTVDWEIDRETEIVGCPTLELSVRPTGDGRSHLMATLQHVSVDGSGTETVTTIKDQVSPIAVESEATVAFDLPCIQQTFAPGDRLRLALATGSPQLVDAPVTLQEPTLFLATEKNAGVELRDTAEIELTASTDIALPPLVGDTPPKNPRGDGLYRHVRGEDEFTILDVQALFNNLSNPTLQKYAGAFNFSGTRSDEVTILDVQALFNDLPTSQ